MYNLNYLLKRDSVRVCVGGARYKQQLRLFITKFESVEQLDNSTFLTRTHVSRVYEEGNEDELLSAAAGSSIR